LRRSPLTNLPRHNEALHDFGGSPHAIPWEDGGETNADNLNAICSRHHHGKHEAGWQPERQPDDSVQWTSPTGHTYVQEPATYPIDRTTDP
jgi:hypothetical protein